MLRVRLLCIGRVKVGLERDLAQRYFDRATAAGRQLGFTFECRELDEARGQRSDLRKADEAARLRLLAGSVTRGIALDEAGEAVDSPTFAKMLARARDDDWGELILLIGGPDGLAPDLLRDAYRTVAFGAMTWPHQLVRIMACEQLYRAVTILAGHPYHRA